MFKTSKKRALATPLALILTLAVFASLLVFPSAQAETPAAAGKVYELDFNENSTIASDRSQYVLLSAQYNLAVGAIEGNFGYNAAEDALEANNIGISEAVAMGARLFFYTENPEIVINGSDYRFVKIRMKSTTPFTATTLIALRHGTENVYYGFAHAPQGVSDWVDVVIDLDGNFAALAGAGNRNIEGVGLGAPTNPYSFVLEILDHAGTNSYLNTQLFVSGMTFYEKAEDVYGGSKVLDFSTPTQNGYSAAINFDLHTGGRAGVMGYDDVEKTICASPDGPHTVGYECGARIHFTVSPESNFYLAPYRYMKLRFKSSVPLSDATGIRLHTNYVAYNYASVVGPITAGEDGWIEVVFDLHKASDDPWNDITMGTMSADPHKFCIEICHATWAYDYPVDWKINLDSVVFGATTDDLVNYTRLNNAIAAADALNGETYTATSWNNVQTALTAAKAALNATAQKTANDAAKALNDAVAALVVKPDVTALTAAIQTANGLNGEDYSEDSWQAVVDALAVAQAALTSESQGEIDAAAEALNAALAGLGNTVALNAKIAEAEAYELADYTTATRTALTDALATAYAALDNGDQDAIDAAIETLTAAIAGLVKMPITDALNAAIAAAEALTATDYTSATWAVVAEKLEAAKATLASESQDEVDAAAKALTDAIDALVKMPTLDALNAAIAAAEALIAEVYTEATWADMQETLAAAKAVLTSEDQAEVDAAVAALNAAVAALEKLPAADILKIDFTAPNAVKGAVEDDELANIYLGKVTYDLGLGGVEGKVSFDKKTGLATTKKDSATDEALACGIRMFFYAKDAANLINGTDYNYLKIRFKSNQPITDTTIVAIRDAATHWNYYGAAYKLNKVGDWYEALIDLNANHMESPMGSIKDAVLGEGDTFCVEFLDVGSFGANREWADSYGNGLEISLESLTFFANEDDAKDSLTAPDTGMGADYTALLVCLMVMSAMAVIVVASKRRKTR